MAEFSHKLRDALDDIEEGDAMFLPRAFKKQADARSPFTENIKENNLKIQEKRIEWQKQRNEES